MTAAALSHAVISDPRIFENEPVCTSNYSSSGYMAVNGSLLPLLLFNFNSFSLSRPRQMLQRGEDSQWLL